MKDRARPLFSGSFTEFSFTYMEMKMLRRHGISDKAHCVFRT